MTIGIPRALFYFKNPYFWEVFFEGLGFKVILSPPTNKEIVERGVKVSDPETCFSIKVFFGHILWLLEKVDYIFVPRLKTNKEKLEYCPKFFGIPDLAKILVSSPTNQRYCDEVKTPILVETFDCRRASVKKTLERLGKRLTKDKEKTNKAIRAAFEKEKEIKKREKEDFLLFRNLENSDPLRHSSSEAGGCMSKRNSASDALKKPKILLISHQYNLYDNYVNLNVKEKLEKLDAQVIFINEVPASGPCKSPLSIKFHWEFGKEIMENIQEALKCGISGAVEISSFQCGCDAVLKEFVEKEFKKRKIPFLYLIIDEQTGEAGFQTRLEAFMDTIK